MQSLKAKVTSEVGIHARPATILVNKAGQYSSELNLHFKDKEVNLKSIMGVMSLGIKQGETIEIKADGEDEQEAIDGLKEVLEGEDLAEMID